MVTMDDLVKARYSPGISSLLTDLIGEVQKNTLAGYITGQQAKTKREEEQRGIRSEIQRGEVAKGATFTVPVTQGPGMAGTRRPATLEEQFHGIERGDVGLEASRPKEVLYRQNRFTGEYEPIQIEEGQKYVGQLAYGVDPIKREQLEYRKRYDAKKFSTAVPDWVKNHIATARAYLESAKRHTDIYGRMLPEGDEAYREAQSYLDALRPYFESKVGADIKSWMITEIPELQKGAWGKMELGTKTVVVPDSAITPAQSQRRNFDSVEEAEAADLPKGTTIYINGKKGILE